MTSGTDAAVYTLAFHLNRLPDEIRAMNKQDLDAMIYLIGEARGKD